MRFSWPFPARRSLAKPVLQLPFHGHDALLQALAARLQDARSGQVQLVTLEGPPSSGKSSLLEEWRLRSCLHPSVFLISINAAEVVLPQDMYHQLLVTLRERSERILQALYNDTKRIRKTLGFHWEEREFLQMIMSADWSQLASIMPSGKVSRDHSSPINTLLASVQQHPWVRNAAVLLESMTRGAASPTAQRSLPQRWEALLQALYDKGHCAEQALVIVFDHLETLPRAPSPWAEVWRTLVQPTQTRALPVLMLWAGSAAGLSPVVEGLRDFQTLTTCQIEPLASAAAQYVLQRAARALPRPLQTPWRQLWETEIIHPDASARLLLATACATAVQPDPLALRELTQADISALVDRLLSQLLARTSTEIERALCRQLLEAWAFFAPAKTVHVEDLLPLCDLEALGLSPVAGRTGLEKLLGHGVRYGLWQYDPYTSRYTVGHSAIQAGLQQWLYPDLATRQAMAICRRLATAILSYIRQGATEMLTAFAPLMAERLPAAPEDMWETVLVAPFRRVLPACVKAERQRMALALGGFRSPLAVALLQCLMHDEEEQVRSGAVQALADLDNLATQMALLEALGDSNSDVRWIATRALGHIIGTTAVNALIPMLQDEDKEVGRIAAEGLGLQGDPRAVPHLIAAMRDSYALLRESAALALGQLADKRALPALQEMLHDANPQVRRSVERALAQFATSSS